MTPVSGFPCAVFLVKKSMSLNRKKIRYLVPEQFREYIQKVRGKSVYHDYYDKLECIYIHIPKAAGSSVGMALFGTDKPGHYPIKDFEWENEKKFNKYYKFTFVRNPYSRLESAFFYLKEGGKSDRDKEFSRKFISKYKSFEDFITNGLQEDSIKNWIHFIPQCDFLINHDGLIDVDFIGKLENIEIDFIEVCEKLNIKRSLCFENRTKQKKSVLYTKNMKEIVNTIYKNDFELLGYEKKI
ncbi:sulfotransferase family 2 domain-containing protein [Salinisphaera sp. G21_0]|uniref:sulfotransferase family 2 domain-containing protein n=1 Tax=Salinisphaera sp. G21_0 TaxID=2821094 RepID=UPI001AD9B155|nr:sulfotransferase family 2 domain-containing protein [Salinisphaera sp. G21_0]MBO9483083.1 sulfotransferase family 2 domain-containing protein [Salinisphaera sp. G21_0]